MTKDRKLEKRRTRRKRDRHPTKGPAARAHRRMEAAIRDANRGDDSIQVYIYDPVEDEE